ncbi:hypothetical protein GCM10007938_25730 [Vibrio zhanjiangensis]|uniref:DUF1240 domain-containing protein n=2 Tax=Vibrio zhanjiangensis TaxID=1046128 RepID=A0ABQ6F248_9VIBR|nr:hypothetical protein GCM10007938_25730 [Vibrio zhanjiangensis]
MINMTDLLKKLSALLFFIAITLWCAFGVYDFSNLVKSVGIEPIIKVSGYFNNTSSFVLFGFFLPCIPMALLNIFLNVQLPKLTLRLMLFGALVFAVLGHYFDSMLRQEIRGNNYVECPTKREVTLKSSSRTYVLDSSLCE